MSRYTAPSSKHHEVTSASFKSRPAWVRFGVWACVIAVAVMALTTVASFFV
ncbi:MAG TPA: hypothetical protein VMW08_05760 [Acidimicrobiales bacterium]|nr:hypothetical protein [Acidimicrobiales bacterium]